VLALQSGEPGPIAQAIAGIDIALWDLQARRQALPLWQWLGGDDARVSVYASGLNPTAPERLAAVRRDDGYRGFKLKVGFGPDRDSGNLRALRRELGDDMLLLADANQAWDLSRALREAPPLAAFGLGWLEEPLRADRGWPEWQRLAAQLSTPLAAGENVTGEAGFDAAIGSGALGIIQPDIAKWGGFTGGVAVARRIVAAGRQFCPHWLGGGIGLLASAHLLAAIGGGGLLEIDANPNPLRTLCWGPLGRLQEGMATLTGEPGLGAPPDLAVLRDFAVTH
jgi:D-galactarolactone cycloisomerase